MMLASPSGSPEVASFLTKGKGGSCVPSNHCSPFTSEMTKHSFLPSGSVSVEAKVSVAVSREELLSNSVSVSQSAVRLSNEIGKSRAKIPTGIFANACKVMCGVRASASTYAICLIPGKLSMIKMFN